MTIARRSFIRNSGSLLLGTALVPAFSETLIAGTPGVSAADQLNVGVIGVNGMGWSNLQAILQVPGVKCVALCDVDENVLKKKGG